MRPSTLIILILLPAASLCRFALAEDMLFEVRTDFGERFTSLDFSGDAKIGTVEDLSCPPGFGPNVLSVRGTLSLLIAHTPVMKAGTLVALWREMDAQNLDSDGILLFGGKFPDDLSEAHNTKKLSPHYWMEQDTDSGLGIRYLTEALTEITHVETPGEGLTDGAWNRVGWFWQKVTFDAKSVRAKYWSFVDPEPATWSLTAPVPQDLEGRIGLRSSSGHLHLAYFAASREDIRVPRPKLYIDVGPARVLAQQDLVANLFLAKPLYDTAKSIRFFLDRPGGDVRTWQTAVPAGRTSPIPVVIHRSGAEGETDSNPAVLDAMPAGRYRLRAELSGSAEQKPAARTERSFVVTSDRAIQDRIERVRAGIRSAQRHAAALSADGKDDRPARVVVMTAERLLALASQRVREGRFDQIAGPLQYAEDALATLALSNSKLEQNDAP